MVFQRCSDRIRAGLGPLNSNNILETLVRSSLVVFEWSCGIGHVGRGSWAYKYQPVVGGSV